MKQLLIITLFAALFMSCEDERSQPVVLTEDVLYLSGQIVSLSGRIYDNGGGKITEHGFEISISEDFNDDITDIKLGETEAIGQFIGSDSTLLVEQQYFYRAYSVVDGAIYYGETKAFQTLDLNIKSFSPVRGYVGDELTIIGANFGTDTKVFFNNIEANILEIFLESIITVEIPETSNSAIVDLKIIQNGIQQVFSKPFEYVTGEWKQIGSFINNENYSETVAIENENELIYGLGVKANEELNNNIWKLDFNTWEWSAIDYTGSEARGAYFNNLGIVGGGVTLWPSDAGDYLFNDTTWTYQNEELSYLTNSPLLYFAQSFAIDNESYIAGGLAELTGFTGPTTPNRDIYKFNATTLNWDIIGNAPIDFNSQSISFTSDQQQYFLNRTGSFWKYDPARNSWEELRNTPLEKVRNGFAVVIDDKVIIGGAYLEDDVWEYDVSMGSWNLKHRFPGDLTRITSTYFSHDSKLYVIRASPRGTTSQQPMTIWEFDPNQF